ncbi:MAG: SPOR domain-containing protein [Steroidobacteraceae bacterium]
MRSKWIVACIVAAVAMAACSRQESGWREALAGDSIASYEQYLSEFPAGSHAAEARAKLLELRDHRLWALANRLKTPEAWQRYLGEWPDGAHAAEARRQLAEYVPAGVPSIRESYVVQLGAYSTEAAARAALARLSAEHAGQLAGDRLRILAPRGVATPTWRLRTGPLEEPAARDLCARLKARAVDCVPLPG